MAAEHNHDITEEALLRLIDSSPGSLIYIFSELKEDKRKKKEERCG